MLAIRGPWWKQERFAVGIDDPKIERPSIEQRRYKAARVDDGVMRVVGEADRRPVAMREVDVAEGERARHK